MPQLWDATTCGAEGPSLSLNSAQRRDSPSTQAGALSEQSARM